MGFGDLQTAAEFRDVIEKITQGVVNKMRPDLIVGKVYSYNKAQQKAQILLPGETIDNVIVARFALDKVPTLGMDASFASLGYDAPGDIVRLYGGSGSYFILDYVYGKPEGISSSGGGDGGSGGSSVQTFYFNSPSTSWQCSHTLNSTEVSVSTYLLDGTEIFSDVAVVSNSTVRVDHGSPQSGYAIIRK